MCQFPKYTEVYKNSDRTTSFRFRKVFIPACNEIIPKVQGLVYGREKWPQQLHSPNTLLENFRMDTRPRRPNCFSIPPSHLEETQEFFSCSYPDCDYISNWEENVGTHEKEHNPSANSNIPCQVCPQSFGYLVSFFYHMSSQHSKKLFCPWCLFLGEDLDELKTHMLAHVLTPSVSSRPKTDRRYFDYNCATCPQTFTRKKDFFRHQKQCNSNDAVQKKKVQRTKLACDKCSFTTLYASNFRTHSWIHSGEKPFKCTNLGCAFMTRWRKSLRQHQQWCRDGIQTSDQAAVVGKKQKKGTTETLMKRVKSIEGEALLFHCSICSFRSKWQASVTNHLRVHSDHKPFHCPRKGCKYRTKWSGDLKKHARFWHRNKAPKPPVQTTQDLRPDREFENGTESAVNSSSSMAFACMLCDFIGDSQLSAFNHASQHKTVVISLN